MSDEWTPERIAELRQHLDAGVPTWIQNEDLSSLLDALEGARREAEAEREQCWWHARDAGEMAIRLDRGRVCLESIRETDSKDVIMYGVRDALKALG